jgi:glycosyltransferase involved in cell wall biosynthesis/SAM-dependent methyltransferase
MKNNILQHHQEIVNNIKELINENRLNEAKELLNNYEETLEYAEDIYSIKAIIAMVENDTDRAENILIKGLEMYPKNLDLVYNLAYLYEIKQKYIFAYRYYKKALNTKDEQLMSEIKIKIEELEKVDVVKQYKSKRKVLMVAYAFPPIGGPGVQRTLKFVKYLRDFGWEPIVLTVGNTAWETKDESLLKEIPEEVAIIRIDDIKAEQLDNAFLNRLFNMYGEIINDNTLFQKYLKALKSDKDGLNNYLFIPEYQAAWALKVVESIERYIDMNEIDLVYTSADPNADNFIGYFLKKNYKKPWVADFRDAWTKNPYTNYDKQGIKYEIECRMEQNIVPYADYVLTATPLISKDFTNDLNLAGKVETITNGYDEADFKYIEASKSNNSKFTIMHNGLFYQIRTPLTFLTALKNILDRNLINRSTIKVHFTKKDYWYEVVKEMGLDDVVEFTGYMNHENSIRKAISCDMLILIVGKGEKNKSIYTGKVFEYLRLCKPILSLSPKGSLVDDLIKRTNRGINVEYDDLREIENQILTMYKNWENGKLPNLEVTSDIMTYERKSLTKELSRIFTSTLSKSAAESLMDTNKIKNLKEKDSNFYDRVFASGGWDETYFKHYSEIYYFEIWSKALELIKQIDNPSLIDIGCGPGQFAKLIFDNNITDYKGIDFSQEAIKYAKIRNDKYRKLFSVDNAYTTDLVHENYNTAIIFEVLEHVDEDLKILSRIREATNILFSVPSFYSDGHVRWFDTEQQVIERYKDNVIIENIFKFSLGGSNIIYLIKGKIS